MSRTLATALVLGSFAAWSSPSSAAPLNYNESASGDIGSVNPLVTFTLGPGVNTISGIIGDADSANPPPVDFDSFAFVVPAGLRVTAGQLTMSDVAGNLIENRWVLYRGLDQTMPIQDFQQPTPGSSAFTVLPLGPDAYHLLNLQMTGIGLSSYTFSMTVVPEPASLALLAPVVLLARRRRA
jgi:hypothetical protein